MNLERMTSYHFESLRVDHYWINRCGEANSFPDIFVHHHGDLQIDCKGSQKYYGSMFLGLENHATMEERRAAYGQIWFVLNDLSIVEFREYDAGKERKDGGYRFAPEQPRSINQWLKEIEYYEVRS